MLPIPKLKQIQNFTENNLKIFLSFSAALLLLAIYFIINSPDDYQQGNAVKIMYIHVPSAWLALLIYSAIAGLSCASFIYKTPLLALSAISLAPIGCCFAILTLVTGSIWGKPIWGTWWVWDARLTSMLVLFFLYVGYIALYHAYDQQINGSKMAALLAIIGFINIPIIKFSVDLWNSLHQPASIIRSGGMAIVPEMQKPLFVSFAALCVVSFTIFLLRLNSFLYKIKQFRKR